MITNSNTKLPHEDGTTLNYSQILTFVVRNSAAAKGVTIGEMRDRLKLLALLEAAKDKEEIDLTEEQQAQLATMLDEHRFPMDSEDLITLADTLRVT